MAYRTLVNAEQAPVVDGPEVWSTHVDDIDRGSGNSMSNPVSNGSSGSGTLSTCPTCRGLGKIPKDRESELVALIPLNDERLHPRTKLKVAITLVVCAIVAGLVIFFLIPRSVTFSSTMPKIIPQYSHVNASQHYVLLEFFNKINITNENYFGISLGVITMTAMHDTKVLNDARNKTTLYIPMRSTRPHYVHMNLTFQDEEGYVAQFCALDKWVSQIFVTFMFEATTDYLGHTEQMTLTAFQHIKCAPTHSPKAVAKIKKVEAKAKPKVITTVKPK